MFEKWTGLPAFTLGLKVLVCCVRCAEGGYGITSLQGAVGTLISVSFEYHIIIVSRCLYSKMNQSDYMSHFSAYLECIRFLPLVSVRVYIFACYIILQCQFSALTGHDRNVRKDKT